MKRLLSVVVLLAALVVSASSPAEAVTVSPAVIPFESIHPYADDTDDLWVYDHGTPGFALHFSLLELASDGDVIEILDAADNVLETISGTWAGGYLSVRIPTSVGKVHLVSNSSGVGAGFVVDRAYSIGASVLDASSATRPTSLQFGPDGRLYVALMGGDIHAYTVVRNGPNDYAVTSTETISEIHDILNHDDDGALNAAVVGRLLTGLWVEGTAANPVIFATSSDPRTKRTTGNPNGDTNSGVLSRLTWDGAAWVHLPLVRGLARSALNHASNGLVREPATNTIYVAQGGQTNQGGSSAFSKFVPEYALSGAVLSIDLTAIGEVTYDLPTLDDPARVGDPDAGDPFGGSDGANQGVIDPSGPVQIYAPGFRNPFDLELTAAGRLYVTDNGPSDDFGGPPTDEGAAGICTSPAASPGLWAADGLHYVPGPGYYGGHPNPVRGNPAGSPFGAAVPVANPVECDYQESGTEDASIASFPASTNGIDEYTPTNLDGLLTGNLFTISWDGTLSRVVLTPTGEDAVLNQPFIPDIGVLPLDVTIPGVGDPFPGTVWVIDWSTGAIHIFETEDSGDTTALMLSSASVDGTSLVLTYDEALDDASTPASTDYGVGTDGDAQSVTGVVVSGSTVTLTLSPGVGVGDTITIDYTPGASPVQDVAGNDAVPLVLTPVTNATVGTPPTAPTTVSVTPAGPTVAVGTPLQLTGTFADANGWADLRLVQIQVANTFWGSPRCVVQYNQNSNELTLYDGTSWLNAGSPGSGATVVAAECSLNAAASTVGALDATTLAVTIELTFTSALAGDWNLWLRATDDQWTQSSPDDRGDITVGTPATAPTTVSVTPAGPTVAVGTPLQLTGTFADANGWADLRLVQIQVANTFWGSPRCVVQYNQNSNELTLYDGTSWLNAGSPGSGATVVAAECSLNAAASTVGALDATTLAVTIELTFTSALAGDWNLWLRATDDQWTQSSPDDRGDITVGTPPTAPTTVSVTPAGPTVAVGTPLQLTGTFADANGWADLRLVQIQVANTFWGSPRCVVQYNQNSNELTLYDGTSWLNAGSPGSGATVVAAECSLNAAASTVGALDATTLAVTIELTFTSALAGDWNLWLRATDDQWTQSSPDDRGDVTIGS